MVHKIFSFISKESIGIHQAAFLLGFFAILSQILGFFRDRLLAHNFGAGIELDLYYAAFRLPDFIFVSVASLVSVSVLIPILVEKLDDKEKAKRFIDTTFSFFFSLIIFVSAITFFLAPTLLKIIFPGFEENLYPDLTIMTRALLLSPIFLGLSNLLASITQVYKRFVLYAISPIIYNLGIIVGIVFLVPIFGVIGVAIGVAFGAFGHFAVQLSFVLKSGLFPRFSFSWQLKELKKTLLLSIPRTLALGFNQISVLVLISLATFLVPGSITIFNFSFNLQSAPLSIIGVSYSLAAFPTLAWLFSNGQMSKFVEQVSLAAKHIIFWSLPAAVLIVVLRAQIVRTVLGSGQFSWSDTRLTAASLAIFSFSILFQGLSLLFIRGYYSAGRTKKPLLVSFISSLLVIIFSFSLIKIFNNSEFFRYFIESLFKVENLEGSVSLMLALGFSLGMAINGFVLWILFSLDFPGFARQTLNTFFQSLSSSIIAGFFCYLALQVLVVFLNTGTFLGIFLQGFLAGLVGIVVGVIILYLLDSQELKDILQTFRRKFWKTKVIGSDPEIV